MTTGYNTKAMTDVGPRYLDGAADFSCFCVDSRFHQIVGDFDERFVPAYYEDGDAHWRIRLAGWEASSYAPYFHHGSATVKNDAERQVEISKRFPECQAYFVSKWGALPENHTYSRPFDPSSAMSAEEVHQIKNRISRNDTD